MKTTIQDYIYIQPNFFNTKFCNKVLKEVKTLNFTPNLFYNPNNDVSTDRSGETESLMSSELIPSNDLLLKQLWIGIKNYYTYINSPYFTRWQGFSQPRYNKYLAGKEMVFHADHVQSLFDGDRKGIPILSVVGLLNNNFKGGNFILYNDSKEKILKLKAGDLLIFPSIFIYTHRVSAVTQGTRFSFASWVW
jgi:hypothetical protein